jgi:hypothetical protein
MGEFFKFPIRFFNGLNLRQKMGLFTFVLAWAFMFGWVRSYFFYDAVSLSSGIFALDTMSSSRGFLWWGSQKISEPELGVPAWTGGRFADVTKNDVDPNIKWYGPWKTFGVMVFSTGLDAPTKFWIIPYWSGILTLTLIAFWLLISKPRKAIQPKITRPGESSRDSFLVSARRKLM